MLFVNASLTSLPFFSLNLQSIIPNLYFLEPFILNKFIIIKLTETFMPVSFIFQCITIFILKHPDKSVSLMCIYMYLYILYSLQSSSSKDYQKVERL